MRLLLLPFSLLYGLVIALRNKCYDWQWCKSSSFPVPVIAIGNLSVGGTGKSPMTLYLASLFPAKPIAVLSRGYGRKSKGFRWVKADAAASACGDEPLQYAQSLSNARVAVCEDRVEGVSRILNEFPDTQLVLLDDAYQHRAIKAGLYILLTTFQKPYCNDYLLPAGNLREGRAGAKRAQVIIVTKCPADLSVEARHAFRQKLNAHPAQQVFFSFIRYREQVLLSNGSTLPLSAMTEKPVFLFCGLADPASLVDFIQAKASRLQTEFFPDHHPYSTGELQALKQKIDMFAKGEEVLIVTTRKDYMRISSDDNLSFAKQWPLAIIDMEPGFFRDEQAVFETYVKDYVDSTY